MNADPADQTPIALPVPILPGNIPLTLSLFHHLKKWSLRQTRGDSVVGSTSRLIKAVTELPNKQFIVATDNGIFHKMKKLAEDKQLIKVPTAGVGATCESCAHCPWMAMNSLNNLASTLEAMNNEIIIDETIRQKAVEPLTRMMSFGQNPEGVKKH